MIKVETIEIEQFRGIINLVLDFKKENFAICGPNGTGKSGVVDALEFVITGSVSRLTGRSRGELSVEEHAPHVDKRSNPALAKVKVKIFIPILNKSVTIERNVKNFKNPTIVPREPDVLRVLRTISEHPEFVLSRREIIKYVLATPGDRAEEVQSLLQLDNVEKVRKNLQTIYNACEREFKSIEIQARGARDNLMRAMGLTLLNKDQMLSRANEHRLVLGLPALEDISKTGSLKDGMETPSPTQPQIIPKAQAFSDLQATRAAVAAILSTDTTAKIEEGKALLEGLIQDSALVSGFQLETFYSSGLKLLLDGECPFCNKPWDLDTLKAHVGGKLAKLKEISQKKKILDEKLIPLQKTLGVARAGLNTLRAHSSLLKPELASAIEAKKFADEIKFLIETMSSYSTFNDALDLLEKIQIIPENVTTYLSELETSLNGLPDPSAHDASKAFLNLAQDRLETMREVLRKEAVAKAQVERANLVFNTYSQTNDQVLKGLYSAVEKDFAAFYSYLNEDDEEGFTAKLTPSAGKLGFGVDFYDRGFFPPGAYHSEGHQDSMGLCLYLALMRHLQGEKFTFSVLDDVLMSVDVGHRRKVCSLLRTKFPDTQFIITTHDRIWLQNMRTEKLIKSKADVHFRDWSVDGGPRRWDEADPWAEIETHLTNNDVRSAAVRLRNYLEYIFSEICQRLRVPVDYRVDAHHNLGELLPPAIAHFKELLRKGKDAASSWDQRDKVQALATKDQSFTVLALSSKAEEWYINPVIHYNEWENMERTDFAPVVKAFKELIEGFDCPQCHLFLWVEPNVGSKELVRCECGTTMINLKRKPV